MKLMLRKGMEAVVVGGKKSGIAAIKLLHSKGFSVRLLEKEENTILEGDLLFLKENNIPVLYGSHNAAQFSQCDIVVLSPGIRMKKIYELLPKEKAPILIGEIELAYAFLGDEPIIGVTGTSGKSTVSTLIAKMLERHGLRVFLGGNIGVPLSEYILSDKKADVIVMELSSFQLQSVVSFSPKVAVLTNITPNHLDYHESIQEYTESKMRLFKKQGSNDFAFIYSNMRSLYDEYGIHSILKVFDTVGRFKTPYLKGKHNDINAEVAFQVSKIFGVTEAEAQDVLLSFKPLSHRLEEVIVANGITYVNDSKSTTVDSLSVALDTINTPIILLAGGKFKGGDFVGLRDMMQEKVKYIVLFGGGRHILTSAWSGVAPIVWYPTLEEAVVHAKREAEEGDTVLLSPANASFDLFHSYEERGIAFKKAVLEEVHK
ncbi:MAG: UDP-N-acetylmuramoyl-L-alanine--D-glutamate ligase [Desulfovibrionaceae bacterium]